MGFSIQNYMGQQFSNTCETHLSAAGHPAENGSSSHLSPRLNAQPDRAVGVLQGIGHTKNVVENPRTSNGAEGQGLSAHFGPDQVGNNALINGAVFEQPNARSHPLLAYNHNQYPYWPSQPILSNQSTCSEFTVNNRWINEELSKIRVSFDSLRAEVYDRLNRMETSSYAGSTDGTATVAYVTYKYQNREEVFRIPVPQAEHLDSITNEKRGRRELIRHTLEAIHPIKDLVKWSKTGIRYKRVDSSTQNDQGEATAENGRKKVLVRNRDFSDDEESNSPLQPRQYGSKLPGRTLSIIHAVAEKRHFYPLYQHLMQEDLDKYSEVKRSFRTETGRFVTKILDTMRRDYDESGKRKPKASVVTTTDARRTDPHDDD